MARPADPGFARPVVEAMEERILHSADLAGLAVGTGMLSTGALQPAFAAQPQQASANEIAFVDLSLPDAAGMVADLRQQQAAGRPIEVVTIGADEDGLAVMSGALAGRSGLDAVHVLAHGSDGRLQLGTSVLDAAALLQRAPEVAGWSAALAPGADLLLYGCDLAGTTVGQSLVQDIADLTGADVAASTDLTGAAERGGDWTLEYTTGGPIHAASAVSAAEQASWQGLMATYTVTSVLDQGVVPGTLRWAIDQANAQAGTDTIVFAVDGTFSLAGLPLLASQSEDGNASGDLDITDSVEIVGNGAGRTIIDGGGQDRVFDVRGGSVTLSGMTIQNGASAQGGGVRVVQNAALTLNDAVVQNNNGYNRQGKGGGIYTDGRLALNRTRVQQNGDGSARVNGAGIYVDTHGSLNANDAELSQNRAGNTDGGGIYVHAGASAILQRATLADNSATFGGGVDNFGAFSGTNITFSGNSASQYGGAAWTSGSFVLDHATVADNSAPDAGGVYAANGFTAGNSLFANNGGGNSHSVAASNGYNLSTDGTLGLSGPGDRNNTGVALQGLADNGGFGRTRATASGNPAVNAANPNDGVTTDQRGVARSGRADIGAYELALQPPTISTIGDQRIDEDGSTGAINFTVGDPDTNVDDLVVEVRADDGKLLPASGVVLGGNGGARTLTLTPAANANGRSAVTVTVRDPEGNAASTRFTLTVDPVNDAPTVNDKTVNILQGTVLTGQVTGSDVDGDALSYAKGVDPLHGTLVVAVSGAYVYMPLLNFVGTDRFVVAVSDGNGGVVNATITVQVGASNRAPAVTDAAQATAEDTPVSGRVTGSDADGDPLTYAKGSDPRNGTAVVAADGRWTYTPNRDFNGDDSFTVIVSDGKGGTATSTVRLTVTPVNDAPTVGDTAQTTAEDTPASGQVQGADVDGDALSYAKGSDPRSGTAVVAADGRWTYTPNRDFNGNDSFTVIVNDGKGGTATSTVRLTVTPVNDAPTVGDDNVATAEDTSVAGQVQGADVDGDALSYAKGSDPRNGTAVVAADGRWTYTPNRNFNGNDSFTVIVNDGKGGTATSTVRLTVTPVNDAPTVGDTAQTTAEDTPVSGQVQGADVDGDALGYGKGSDPRNGAVVVAADGRWTYTPNRDFNGTDSFTVIVSDGNGGTAISTVRLIVTPVNDAPTITDAAQTTAEDTPVSGRVQGADVDGDALSYAKGSDPRNGTAVVAADGRWTYTPNRDFNGNDSFTVIVNDGNGGTATSTVRITVTSVNDAPTVGDTAQTTAEDTPVSGQVQGADVDGDALGYGKGSDPRNGTAVVAADGRWTYTPNRDFNGNDSFTVIVSDGKGGTATSTVRLTVTPVNDAPTVGDDNVATAEDTSVAGQVQGADVDGDALSYAKGGDPRNGTAVVAADGRWTYTPNRNFNGNDSFTVIVNDGNGGTATSTVRITVTPVNDAPTVGDYAPTTAEDTPVSGQVQGADVDGDALSYAKGSDPRSGTAVVAADGRWTYTPNRDFNGNDSFTVIVSDGKGGMATSTVRITVTPVNDAPTVSDYNVSTGENLAITGQVNGGDVDGDTLSYAKGSDPLHGIVVVTATGLYVYTPSSNYNGVDRFTVVVSDGQGGAAVSTVTINVGAVNDAPVVGDDAQTTAEDTPVSGAVQGSDVDGDALSYAKASDPRNGTAVVAADGRWTYTPNQDFNGSDSFTVVVSDGNGGTAVATVRITVTPVDDPSVLRPDTATTPEDTPASGNVLDNDGDVDDALRVVSFQVVGQSATVAAGGTATVAGVGRFTLAADGQWQFTPDADWNGRVPQIAYTTNTGAGSTLDITVTPVNDAPVMADMATGTDEDAPLAGRLAATDVDGDTLTYAKAGDPLHGKVVVAPDGGFVYTPDADFYGDDRFDVRVSDGQGGSTRATVRIAIAPVNDGPRAGAALPAQQATARSPFGYTMPADAFVDPDGDSLRYSATLASGAPLPDWLGFDAATGRFSGMAPVAQAGQLLVRVRATDPQGLYADTMMSLDVTAVPVPAVAPAPAEPPPVAPAAAEPPPPMATSPAEPQPFVPALASPRTPAAAVNPLAPADAQVANAPALASLAPDAAFPSLIVRSPIADAEQLGGVARWTARAVEAAPPLLRLPMEAAHWLMRDPAHRPDALATVLPDLPAGEAAPHARAIGHDEARRLLDEARQAGASTGVLRLSVAGTGTLAASSLSIGYVFWLLRGGVLASAMLSALPAWQMIDPLPVMAASRNRKRPKRGPVAPGEREVERLFDRSSGATPASASPASPASSTPAAASSGPGMPQGLPPAAGAVP
ncbi:tandem-95 repeat protein [Pseudacidovorax intermedius]|uniref:tandem-95 repeat protein n=1 Tax=Pseudacidovorax intermedius TaxID=433924 RepID=UPI000734D089|nr:Ig-like domain-containing protein [Pseudacidovorax intermedius]